MSSRCLQEALHIIQDLHGQDAGEQEPARPSFDGQQENVGRHTLSRTLTNDTIEGQIYPSSRVPLLLLQSEQNNSNLVS